MPRTWEGRVLPMAEDKRSKTEHIKEASNYLRGTIAEELARGSSHFSEEDYQILKFHGVYQQDDRDVRRERQRGGQEPRYMFMIRTAIPGGVLAPEQYLECDRLADAVGNGTLRVTTRQNFQFHGVLKGGLKPLIRGVNDALVTTLSGCGDVERNLVGCPAPQNDGSHRYMREYTRRLAEHLRPKTRAYFEIWVREENVGGPTENPGGAMDGVKIHTTAEEMEPIYGKTYMPRKFKTSIGFPHDNCVDVYAHDIGIILITDASGILEGFNVLVGGGMGMNHTRKDTFPRLADPLAFVEPEHLVDVVEKIVLVQRDNGNRADRAQARMKYLVHKWGIAKFKEEVQKRLGHTLAPPRPLGELGIDYHTGWREQGDGKLYLGVYVENGRIKDEGRLRLRAGLRDVIARFEPEIRLTPTQNVILAEIRPEDRAAIDATLAAHGYHGERSVSRIRQLAMACPALPTCGLAITESERFMPSLLDGIEQIASELDLTQEDFSVRMTGCPNGCARPYVADLAFVGRSVGKYKILVGGRANGTRLVQEYADLVPSEALIAHVRPLLRAFTQGRRDGESLGDFFARIGPAELRVQTGLAAASVPTPE